MGSYRNTCQNYHMPPTNLFFRCLYHAPAVPASTSDILETLNPKPQPQPLHGRLASPQLQGSKPATIARGMQDHICTWRGDSSSCFQVLSCSCLFGCRLGSVGFKPQSRLTVFLLFAASLWRTLPKSMPSAE